MNQDCAEHGTHDRIHAELLCGGKTDEYREEVECGVTDKGEQCIEIGSLFQYSQHARTEHCYQHLENRCRQHGRNDRGKRSGEAVHDRGSDALQGQRLLLRRRIEVFIYCFLLCETAEVTDFRIYLVDNRSNNDLVLFAGTVDSDDAGDLLDFFVVEHGVVFQIEAKPCDAVSHK